MKSFSAVGLAVLAMMGSVLWFRDRTRVIESLTGESRDLLVRVTETRARSIVAAGLERRVKTVRNDIRNVTRRFAGKNDAGARLVKTAVGAAAAAGMKVTGAEERSSGNDVRRLRDAGICDEIISYRMTLRGTFSALTKFLQNLRSSDLENKIESIEVSAFEDTETSGAINVVLVLAVFAAS